MNNGQLYVVIGGSILFLLIVVPWFLPWRRSPAVVMTQGIVVDKKHEPERRWTTTTHVKIGDMTIPQTHHHVDDEDWVLFVCGKVGEDQYRTERWEVDRSVWDGSEIGSAAFKAEAVQ